MSKRNMGLRFDGKTDVAGSEGPLRVGKSVLVMAAWL